MEPISLAIGAAIQLGSGIISYLVNKGATDQAQAILERAQTDYGNIDPPTLERLAYEMLGPSAYEQIQQDPVYREAQISALDKLQNVAESGGMTLADRAAQNEATTQAQRAEGAGFNRILNQYDAEGASSSGGRMAAMLSNQQASADRTARTAQDTAADAQTRALNAIIQRGQMGAQFGAQDFNQQARVASARDEISRYNNSLTNRARDYNTTVLPQRNYENRVGAAGRDYQIARDRANLVTGQGQRTADAIAGVGNAIGGAVTYAGSQGVKWPWQQPTAPVTSVEAPRPFNEDDNYNPWGVP